LAGARGEAEEGGEKQEKGRNRDGDLEPKCPSSKTSGIPLCLTAKSKKRFRETSTQHRFSWWAEGDAREKRKRPIHRQRTP